MLLRWIIDRAVRGLGRIYAGRIIKADSERHSNGLVCVNLGCGLTVAPGWINVDASLNALFSRAPVWLLNFLYSASGANRYFTREEYCRLLAEHRFVFHDLARGLPFSDESVDVFYSSHFLEHLFHTDAIRLLKQAYAALRPGGVIRIAIPDLAYAVHLYGDGRKREMLDNYFFVEDRSSFLARHKYMYDFELLKEELVSCGFIDVRRCAYQQGGAPDLDLLDNRPEETLFVEAFK